MAKNIMIQGTTSGAGKSLLTAGLCRLLKQDGLRVAPFKSQNMALNSFITTEGLEMGRAQVMQAEAAGIEPSVQMNPILLKPQSDTGSQVIVNGEVRGVMSAKDYFAHKHELIPAVRTAYNTLAAGVDVVVIEGAGSPAEINLKQQDIVNMGLAAMVDAPVLIAGDIDRGGVFASLYGTVALLEPEERARVKGFLINKFRGDVEILRPGLEMLYNLTGIPVAGVIPYLDVDLEDEDSLAPRLATREVVGVLDIAVIRLPRISNFTDFHALDQVEGVGVRYVSQAAELRHPDLVILPGSKNTMEDLLWLRQCGLESAVKKLAAGGVPVIGICGGYQMLGERLSDPDRVERGGEMAGLGLLPIETIFTSAKVRTRVAGTVKSLSGAFSELSGAPIEGYEIHMGHSAFLGNLEVFSTLSPTDKLDGAVHGNVLGSYLHGLFDSCPFTDALLRILLERRGLDGGALRAVDYRDYKEQQYERLAAALRQSLDMDMLYQIIERSGSL